VLRSYDSRFRTTDRSSVVYDSKKCESIVGGKVVQVLKITPHENSPATTSDGNDLFWTHSGDRTLRIIAIPYKKGEHFATKPTHFIPVIDQLKELHAAGFVHGDIRAFNTVFSDQADQGGLIDFDFSGIPGHAYPQGYVKLLPDGRRKGHGKGRGIHDKLRYWHDWYALGQLIFVVHGLTPPNGDSETHSSMILREHAMTKELKALGDESSEDNIARSIEKLKGLLRDLEEQGWTIQPEEEDFQTQLTDRGKQRYKNATVQGGTGSPPKNKEEL
jgi:hypothetical protein